MAIIGEVTIPAAMITSELTMLVNISGRTSAIWRLRVASALVRLASKVSGLNIKTVLEE